MTSLRSLAWGVSIACLVVAHAPAQKGRDPLSRGFARWLKDYKSGRIDPRRIATKPYLPKQHRDEVPENTKESPKARETFLDNYFRLNEAETLFKAVKERGTAADAKRFLDVVDISLKKKKKGDLSNPTGDFSIFREKAIEVLRDGPCSLEMRKVIADRVEKGLKPAKDREGAFTHAEPKVATALAPVLASFDGDASTKLLTKLLRCGNADATLAAAQGLAERKHGPSVLAVAQALLTTETAHEVTWLATSMARLIQADSPKPEEPHLRRALAIALDKLKSVESWRSRLALIPITRLVRSTRSIPALIELLTLAKQVRAADPARGSREFAGTLTKATNDALVDLTGAYHAANEPEKWQTWWNEVSGKFELAKAKEAVVKQEKGTVASKFFGIPVSGSRVVFVLDCSGSMLWPIRDKNYKPKVTGVRSRKDAPYEQRIERLRKEMERAVKALTADTYFNVTVFGGKTAKWKKAMIPATPKNKKAFAKWIVKAARPGGATPLFDGLELAFGKGFAAKEDAAPIANEVDEMFLLSDGAPTRGSSKLWVPREILQAVQRWNKVAQVRIHTVYLGDDGVDRDIQPMMPELPPNRLRPEELMRRLAVENNGTFQRIGVTK